MNSPQFRILRIPVRMLAVLLTAAGIAAVSAGGTGGAGRSVSAAGAESGNVTAAGTGSGVDDGTAASAVTSVLPSSYNVCEEGRQPVVQSQGEYETCWALTALSAIESRLMPERHLVFSADHMTLNNSFTADVQDGGDYRMVMAYLVGWQGPVLEEQDPYGDGITADNLTPAVHVQEIRRLKGKSLEEFKQEIYQYGPVQTSLYMERSTVSDQYSYYNPETFAYCCTDEHEVTHDVLLLGWDDNYPRENFTVEPPGDGAFLCQNTWGTDFGDGGLFYLSYYDANAPKTGLAFSVIEDTDNYDRIYQTDPCGWQSSEGFLSDTCVLANVYTAVSDERLEAVGFYAVRENTSYEIYMLSDPPGEDEMLPPLTSWTREGSGVLDDAGYYTVKLDGEPELSAGGDFAVAVKVTSPGTQKPAAVEIRKDRYTQSVTTVGKRGYLSAGGSRWISAEEDLNANVCLKAYTREREE